MHPEEGDGSTEANRKHTRQEEWKSLVRRNPEKSRYVIELSFLFGLILDDFKKLKKI